MLASPLLPSPRFEDNSYRPAKDLESFNKLLPPPIEFIEGSSSGLLAIAEGKYQPINESPKKPSTQADFKEVKKLLPAVPLRTAKAAQDSPGVLKSLYTGAIETSWPNSGKPIGCGLNNTGNTCFLNSALQCLLHTPPLLHILSRHSTSEPCRAPKNTYCMICALRQVMSEAFAKQHPITPYPVITKLQAIAKHMRRGRQEDSHEFLRYFVDALQRSALAGFPPKLDPKLSEKTWVHMIFGGLLRSRVSCLSCGHNSDTFDRMMDLSVDIAGVASLKDALRKFVAVDHLRGADKYKCEKCKKHVNADKQFTMQEAPLVLTIHLKRFSPMGRKIGHPIRYDERISLDPFMSEGQFGPSYSLYGVISHAGGGPNSGHYYAHVKGANGSWYEMNDDSVSRVGGAPTGLKNAYILFYIRDKGQALEAALSTTSAIPRVSSAPVKTGIVANMKKRKVVESSKEDERPTPAKAQKRFIGPLLPAASLHSPAKETPKSDPQAETLKKKIAAATSQPGKNTLQSLVAGYADDDEEEDEDDVGEKVTQTQEPDQDSSQTHSATTSSSSTQPSVLDSSPARPKTPRPSASTSATTPASAPANPVSGIPTSSFYGTPVPKKRKMPDGEDDDASYKQWARTPLSPPSSKERRSGPRISSANPYSRLKGSNNLQQRRDTLGSPAAGRKKRFLM